MTARIPSLVVTLCLALALADGCGPTVKKPGPAARRGVADLPIPEAVKKVGILDFATPSGRLDPWGVAIADDLFELLDAQGGRFTVSRLVAGAESTGGVAPVTPELARKLARESGADAVIYGTTMVDVAISSFGEPENAGAPRSNNSKARVTCRVTVRFGLDEVATGRTIAAVLLPKDASADGQEAEAGRALARKLLRQCAQEFVVMVSP